MTESSQNLDETARQHSDEFIGLSEAQARELATQLGLTIRFIRPGSGQMHTMEHRFGRISAIVEDDHVVRADLG